MDWKNYENLELRDINIKYKRNKGLEKSLREDNEINY